METSALMTCNFLKLQPGSSALLCLPLAYISLKMMVVRAMMRRLKLYLAEPDISPLANLHMAVDFCAMTPLQAEHSLDKIHLIKNLIIGGATVSETLKRQIFLALQGKDKNTKIYETYGMSETLSHIALKEVYPVSQPNFTLLEGISIAVDSRQCLVVHAPALNAEPLHTNDIVEISSSKEFRFLGRADNVLNTGGAKVIPEVLESYLKETIDAEIAILGLPDEIFGQKIVMAVEGPQQSRIASAIQTMPFTHAFQKPKQVFFLDKFPRTANGKIQRQELLKKILKNHD